jgi:hypothetical protein
MNGMENNSIFEISRADTLRFRRIVIDLMSEACTVKSDGSYEYDGIGRLGEKQMHAAIKRFICPDESCHEILIDGSSLCIVRDENANNKKRRFVADVLVGNTITEIQTGSFAPLRDKIKWILENTDYNIILIHPVAQTKWVNIIDGKSGEISKRYRSPKREGLNSVAGELYYIREFISSPRFSLVLLMMEAEQYKRELGAGRRKRYEKYELIPVNLLSAHVFKGIDSYRCFIPDGLEERFTVKQFSALSKIRGRDAYSTVHTLCELGLMREDGKIGRAAAYSVVTQNDINKQK